MSRPCHAMIPGTGPRNARQGRRLDLSCRMFFFGDEEFEGEASLLDVSTHGCRAFSSIDLNVGMALKLSLFLSDYQWPLRIDQATVRWVDGQRFGLEFTEIRPAQRERLRALIMKNETLHRSASGTSVLV
ncbi:MAG: PilZ domain-containing protein [Nitrospiraceae bacterium]